MIKFLITVTNPTLPVLMAPEMADLGAFDMYAKLYTGQFLVP